VWVINPIIVTFVFVLGSCIGSFLNVVVYRIPAGKSIVSPPSACPHCHHRLGVSENIPIFGWLWLKGRCRHCYASISVRYPLVEGMTGLLFLLCFKIFGFSGYTLGYWALLSWLLALALIDWDTMTLPNPLTQSGLVAGLVFQTLMGMGTSPVMIGMVQGLMGGVVGAVLGLWLLEVFGFVTSQLLGRQAMGGGDIKLAAMIGAWLSWHGLVLTIFLAAAIGTLIGFWAMAAGWLQRRQQFPFGPFLAMAALCSAFWGDYLWSWYLALIF
jgi:leader peptidase (prepilin peptidase)/N-methyltransferase